MATEGMSKSPAYVPPSQFTPQVRARRHLFTSQLNRCPHGVNVAMRVCKDCAAQNIGPGDYVAGVNQDKGI